MRRPMLLVAAAVVVAAVLVAGVLLLRDTSASVDDVVDDSSFQAVVLSNDRVYFGRFEGRRDDFYLLRNVYFLRESATEGEDPVQEVLPLAAELHRPENQMLIHESQLVLVENLDRDSGVLETIEDLQDP